VLILTVSGHNYAVNASTMTAGPSGIFTVVVNCCGASKNGYPILNQGPSGRFWTVYNGAGINGGNPTNEPMSFYFLISDSASGGLRTIYADAKANWIANGIDTEGSLSGFFGGTISNSYTITNLDPTYSRSYSLSYYSYYV
jgi:hypothetical protein